MTTTPNTASDQPQITWETVTSHLADARRHVEKCEQACGQKIADGEDATVAMQALQAAESQVRQLEVARAVLMQRKEDAADASKEAEQQSIRKLVRKDLTEEKAAGEEVGEVLNALRLAINRYIVCRKKVLEHGYPEIAAQQKDADLSFQTFLFKACPTMPGCADPYDAMKTDEKWKRPWSNMLPQPDLADQVKL